MKRDSSNISSRSRIESVIQCKNRIYFRELKKEANVSTEDLEDFLIPLLGEGKIEGKLEVRCPDCGADLGSFKKYNDIPKENECETCGHTNQFSDNYLEILLEVKGDFFRGKSEPQSFIKKQYTNEQLETLLENAMDEKDETTKGKLFEDFFRNVVERENEFVLLKQHARSNLGEFDYVYKTDCSGSPLWNICKYIFVECKNRKEVVSSKDMNHFIKMLTKKAMFRNCCGIYITTKRFSPQANNSANEGLADGLIIFRIAQTNISELIEKGFKRYLEYQFDELLTKV